MRNRFMFKAFPYHLEFKKPFKIASVERTGTDNLYLRFEKDGFIGWGEAVFPPYISESREEAVNRINTLNYQFENEDELWEVIEKNRLILKNEPSLCSAMETSLLNWLANSKNESLSHVISLDTVDRETSYTIGISSNLDIEKAIKETPEATYFKLKVNQDEIERIVTHYMRCTDLPFVIDANQGFTNEKLAKYWAEKLNDFGVAYFEQPFHKGDLESHRILKNETEIPIIADESFQRFTDLEKVKDCFDGINAKIIKTGGVLEAKKSLLAAKGFGLKTILGCMSGSSVSINSASALSSLADWVDLDGVYLIKNDPDLNSFN